METPQEDAEHRIMPKHGLGIALVLIGMGILFWFFDVDQVRAFVEKGGAWGPIIFILAKASTIVVAPISGSAIYPMAGAVFGFKFGFIYTFIGDALGSIVAFYLSRIFGRKIAERMMGMQDSSYLTHVLDYLDSWRGLIEARIFFSALPEAVAYAAGLSKIPFWRFFLVQMAVAVPTIAILVQFGSLMNMSENPLIIGFLLAASVLVMAGGGALFAMQVKRRAEARKNTP
ncbi:MAG: hypothetical protein RLZZ234_518 [Candidatus Parcubacteria bacterium]|jgi:uncharacterized membrane protein YdjX (TVP38/TMEM64 family)